MPNAAALPVSPAACVTSTWQRACAVHVAQSLAAMIEIERSTDAATLGSHPGEALNARARRETLLREVQRFQLKGWLSAKETDKMRAIKARRDTAEIPPR